MGAGVTLAWAGSTGSTGSTGFTAVVLDSAGVAATATAVGARGAGLAVAGKAIFAGSAVATTGVSMASTVLGVTDTLGLATEKRVLGVFAAISGSGELFQP